VAAALATLLALPGLWMPFLADDWTQLAAVARGDFLATPFGYSRPLYAATFWLDRRIWGLSGSLFHLTNIVLVAAAAGLMVRLALRYGLDRPNALLAGCLFALHPTHVETVAWVAARADLLFSVLVLMAAIAWERWRLRPRGAPWLSIVLFALSLLAKETAIVLPAFLLLADLCRGDRRRDIGATWRGLAPMMALVVGHFLVLWPRGHGQSPLELFGKRFVAGPGGLVLSSTAAILPATSEILELHPLRWVLGALGVAGLIAGLALLRAGRIPALAWAAVIAFFLLLAPSFAAFQDRYLFLPSVALAIGMAVLLRAAGSRGRPVAALLVVIWSLFLAGRWVDWLEAAGTGRRLIAQLTAESLAPGTEHIVVANMPHRIHGAPVVADFRAAVTLQGGRSIPIDSIALIDYPDGMTDALDGSAGQAVVTTADASEVALRVVQGPGSGVVWPGPGRPPGPEAAWGTVTIEAPDHVHIRLLPGAGRAGYYWSQGRLHRLF